VAGELFVAAAAAAMAVALVSPRRTLLRGTALVSPALANPLVSLAAAGPFVFMAAARAFVPGFTGGLFATAGGAFVSAGNEGTSGMVTCASGFTSLPIFTSSHASHAAR